MDQTKGLCAAERAPLPPRRDGLLLAAAALLAYLLLGQTLLFKTDGHYILRRLLAGEVGFYNHFLYMPLLMAFRGALEWVGLQVSPHRAATAFSALGMAAAVAVAHAVGRRLRLRRGDALLVAGLMATAPPVVFFATVVEFHGPFLPFALAAFLAAVALERQPSAGRAVLTGVASGVAFAMHASGLLLPVLLAGWFLAAAPADRRRLGQTAVLFGTHAVACWALANGSIALGFGTFPAPADTAAALRLSSPSRWLDVGAVAWREALSPYLPLSLAWLAALFVRGLRRRALALGAGALPFVALALAVIPYAQTERGAYLLPCVLPAALLAVAALPRVLVLVVLAAGAGFAFVGVRTHDDGGATYERYVTAVRTASGGAPCVLLIAEQDELGACVVAMPEQRYHLLTELAVWAPEDAQRVLPALSAVFQDHRARGERVLISARARAWLRDPANTRSGPLVEAHLASAFELREVAPRMFEVLPRRQ